MNNKTALALALTLIAIYLADRFVFDWGLQMLLGKKYLLFVEYIAFWR